MTPAIAQTPLLSGADRARLAADTQESSVRRAAAAARASASSSGGEDPSRPSHRSNTSAALQGIGKTPAHGKTGSWASRLSLDWTRRDPSRSGSTSFLPLGLFSSFAAQEGGAGTNNRYEPVAPMEAAARKRQKSIFQLDMGDFSEGLRLSTAREGDEDDEGDEEHRRLYHQAQQRQSTEDRRRRKRRKSSGAIGAFVSGFFRVLPSASNT